MIKIKGIEHLMSNFTVSGVLALGYRQLPTTLSKPPSSFVKGPDLIFYPVEFGVRSLTSVSLF